MLPLRFPRLWTALAWSLTAGVIVGSLLPNEVIEAAIPPETDKAVHAASYFILMVSFAGLYRRGLYLIVAAVLLALGVCLDLLQLLTETRSFDWKDIAMNSAGIALGLVLSWSLLGGWCERVERRLLS